MSKRTDIIDGADAKNAGKGLVYTEVLGWVDLGHARGDDIKKYLTQWMLVKLPRKNTMM